MSTLAPHILDLPVELTHRIFSIYTCDGLDVMWITGLPPPVVLSHVCRRWRLIALQQATMWAQIPLDNLAFARLFLERAPGEGLELTQLDIRRRERKSRCPRVHWTQLAALLSLPAVHQRIHHLALHRERCKEHVGHREHLCVRITDDLLNHLPDSGLHSLRSLSLRDWRNLTLRDDIFETCTSLSRLEVIHYGLLSFRALHSLRALETLILHGPSIRLRSEPVDAHALLGLFRALPQLQNLSLYMTLLIETNDLKQQPVELPSLRQLTLRDPSSKAASMLFLLNKMCIPKTARTSVTSDCCENVSAILHCFFDSSHPPDALLLTLEWNSISFQTTVETCAGSRLDLLSSMGCSTLSKPCATRGRHWSLNFHFPGNVYYRNMPLSSHLRFAAPYAVSSQRSLTSR